jgi:hypothetical protein
VLANRLRYLFLRQKTKRKTLFIIMHSTDFCFNSNKSINKFLNYMFYYHSKVYQEALSSPGPLNI